MCCVGRLVSQVNPPNYAGFDNTIFILWASKHTKIDFGRGFIPEANDRATQITQLVEEAICPITKNTIHASTLGP